MLFYHGSRSPYPWSLCWLDEFAAPTTARKLYSAAFPLVDVTVVPDDEIVQHRRVAMLLSGETVNVAIRNGNEAVLIGQLECKSMVRMCAPLGSRLPLHASGAGKALLYPLAEEELMSIILQTGLQQFTPTTLVDMPTLLKDLEQARELGYTVDKEEHVVGLNCIASAIYDDVGSVVAAISISGPSSRLTEDRFVSQGELVRDTARDISTALGLKAHP